jgi:hypothetical protein
MTIDNLIIVPEGKRFFKTDKEQKEFYENFADQIRPYIKENELRRALSEEAARHHYIY